MQGKTRNYTEEFKKQIVSLYQNGKASANIVAEYDIGKSTVQSGLSTLTILVPSKQRITELKKKISYCSCKSKINNCLWRMIF